MNKIQEIIRRHLFSAEEHVRCLKAPDTRGTMTANVNRTNVVSLQALGVELIADRFGWEAFVDELLARQLIVETRRWHMFGDDLFCYDLYVEQLPTMAA